MSGVVQSINHHIKYTLRGKSGWSICKFKNISISEVVELSYHKRQFMIFDRKFPYTLNIMYYKPKIMTNTIVMNPTIYNKYEKCWFVITKRYKTEQDILNEINDIKQKQKLIKN